MENRFLEVACFNLHSALIAHQNGADRVELAENREQGGVTPEIIVYRKCRSKLSIELYVLIRPRGGDFNYSKEEFEQMKKDIVLFNKKEADGFVFGVLDGNKNIDVKRNMELIELADGKPCTFNRAFDQTYDLKESLVYAANCGFKNIITSGGKPTALEGIDVLKGLIETANKKINIIPAGGIRSHNITILKDNLDTHYFHSSALIDNMEVANAEEIKLMLNKIKKARIN